MKKKKRTRVTVRWDSKKERWTVNVFGEIENYVTKVRAVKIARGLARANVPSQLVLFKKNGRIQTEYTYGNDPRRTPG